MSRETIKSIVDWQNDFDRNNDEVEITFHGGEPLVPGEDFYRMALPLLQDGLKPRRVHFSIQSNLWLLTKEMCTLFRQYGMSIGTSLDGPEHINNLQRGKGYFRRTMEKIDLARNHGIAVGCICTFTKQSLPFTREIFDFFAYEGLNFSIHGAVPSLRYPDANMWTLSPEQHRELLSTMLDIYLANLDKIRISTLDTLCRSVSAGKGGVCTFGECLGQYLSIDPAGNIYPCQRFAGISSFRLGNVNDNPSRETMASSPVWKVLSERQKRITEDCGDCSYLEFCHGGCPYNAFASQASRIGNSVYTADLLNIDTTALRDPNCSAYQYIFKKITDLAMEEVFSEENMEEVIKHTTPEKGLLRRGRLLSIMQDDSHPYDTAQHARRILAAVALAATNSPVEATRKFQELGLIINFTRTEKVMQALYQHLNAPVNGLNNLYLHVTFACPLRCTHCYAQAGTQQTNLSVADIIRTCHEAAELGFRHVVITGGEPLIHSQRDELLDSLAKIRQEIKPLLTVLRTSLSVVLDEKLLYRIGNSTDEVVVSVDGDRKTHDKRRGKGNYDLVLTNLRKLTRMNYCTDLSLATVLPKKLVNGVPGDSVRLLAKELGIKRTRFRPVLPIGRAIYMEGEIIPETLWGHKEPKEIVLSGFWPMKSCGMGQNIYVEPDGRAYPCYACHETQWLIGEVTDKNGLSGIINSETFQELRRHTVNTNQKCQHCTLRYLCGGACRAWSQKPETVQGTLDAQPENCSSLHNRARSLLVNALEYLTIPIERWTATGLPLSDCL